jgi:uncharacterized Zn-binding protein involved in type VI secretion
VNLTNHLVDATAQATSAAARKAATLPDAPANSPVDVWKNTGSGLMSPPHSGDFGKGGSPAPALASAADRTLAAAQKAGVHHTNAAGLKAGMSQAASGLAEQALNLLHLGDNPDAAPQGALAHVGAAFGLLGKLEELITMPLGAIPFPAFPALRITDMDIGLPHAHNHPPNLIPPNPVPIPLPSTGPVIPIPFVSGASKVLINGLPAARCGDIGLGIWCGGFFPLYEVFLGSANVWIEGSRAGRLGVDITKHCIFTTPKPNDPPIGPMFGTTVTGSPNVMIGGVPLPSLTAIAMGAAFKALFKKLGSALKWLRKSSKVVDEGMVSVASSGAKVRGVFNRAWRKLRMPFGMLSPNAQSLLGVLRRTGDRVSITHIMAEDLAAMSRHTGDEFALVIDRHGNLDLIRGGPAHASFRANEELVLHTHPHGPNGGGPHPGGGSYQPYPRDIGYDPGGNHAGDVALENNPQRAAPKYQKPKAVVYQDGSVRYYDRNGPMWGGPPAGDSPIRSDGLIDGNRH